MSYKIIAGLVIGGMLLAGCASLPEVSPETSEPPMTDAPDVVSEPT